LLCRSGEQYVMSFVKLDSLVKCRLFTAYCSGFYGSQLIYLDTSEIYIVFVCDGLEERHAPGEGFTR